MRHVDETLRAKPVLDPYVCRVRVEGITLRGKIRLDALLEEFPGIGEVRFRVLSGPWEGATWIRDAGGLFWRVIRTHPRREEIADLSPQVAQGVRLEDLLWSALLRRIQQEKNVEILRRDPAMIRLRFVRDGGMDEFVLDGRTHTPRSWVRWEDGEMILRVFYDPVQEKSASRVIAWAALGVAVGMVSLGLWLWGKGRQNETSGKAPE